MTRSGAASRRGRTRPTIEPELDAQLDDDELADVDVDVDELDGFADLDHHELGADLDDELGPGDGEPEFRVDDDHYFELSAREQEALREQLQDRLAAYLSGGRARVVITDNLRTMMSIKRGHGVYTFRLHHMFLDAPAAVLRAAAAYAERRDKAATELLREFIDANEDAIRQRHAPRAVTIDVEGRYHNLQTIFDSLNGEYFGGAIQARITWGPRAPRKAGRVSIKLGSYTVEDQLIRIHPVLDAEDVPRYYLAWVVYHEMLHEIHDMPVVDGRRVYHTRAFRQAEARFEQYPQAVLWERSNLAKLLNR